MADWKQCSMECPPEGVLVDTKIDDADGVRNEQAMIYRKPLWWAGDMYVYYNPTHWRPRKVPELTAKQREIVRHAIGFDGRHKMTYRNHFVTGPDTEDYAAWMDLVRKGFARHRPGGQLSGGDDIFWATRELALSVRNKDEHLASDFRE